MIKFMCDSCGKDISDKVHDSVRQLCAKDFFVPDVSEEMTQGHGRQPQDVHHGVGHVHGPLDLQVQLLDELSKIIHASAWDMRSASMHCSNCAVKHAYKHKKVVTMFTKVVDGARDHCDRC